MRLTWPRGEEWRQVTVSRDAMVDKSRAIRMAYDGCPISTFNAGSLTQWFTEYEETNIKAIPQVRVSSRMGWHGEGESCGFLFGDLWISPDQGQTIDPKDPLTWNSSIWAFDASKNPSELEVVRGLRTPQGSFQTWLELVQAVVPFPRVLLALYASFAAPLVEVLQSRSIILDWARPSDLGTTAILALAASVWGNPDEKSRAFVKKWPSNSVSLERMAAFSNHLPLILNESHKVSPQTSGKKALELADGCDKIRATCHAERHIPQSWRTVILSSSERNLAKYVDSTDGTDYRVIQLRGDPWDGYRSEVRDLHFALRRHNGHAGFRWLQWLVARRSSYQSQWISRWNFLVNQNKSFAFGHMAAQRFREDLAVIQLAAELVHEALPLPWSVDVARQSILQSFTDLKHHAQHSYAPELALSCVWNWCVQNSHLFDRGDISIQPPAQGWVGRWSQDPSWQEIIINPSTVHDILQHHKFHYNNILREWANADWIRRGDGWHLLAYVSIHGKRARYVVIKRSAIEQFCLDSLLAEN